MRLSKETWLQAGLRILTEQGPEFLKIDIMCKVIKVTKGSFYHHFKNRDDYVHHLLLFWQQENTSNIIAQVEKIQSLNEKSDMLDAITMATETGPEKAFRSWAQYDERVAEFVRQVDQERIQYIEQLIAPQLLPSLHAPMIAKLVYAHFVGCQQLDTVVNRDEWAEMSQLLRQILTTVPKDECS